MSEKEMITRALSGLKASDDTLERVYNMIENKKHFTGRKITSLALSCAMVLAFAAVAFAGTSFIKTKYLGFNRNFEVVSAVDENGDAYSYGVLHTDDLTEPAQLKDGKLIFTCNGEEIDISEEISGTKAFVYEYKDADDVTHYVLVGGTPIRYAYAEYLKDSSGDWAGGYSARINADEHPKWLEDWKTANNCPW